MSGIRGGSWPEHMGFSTLRTNGIQRSQGKPLTLWCRFCQAQTSPEHALEHEKERNQKDSQ